ncbi:MAG: hypothetical protein RIB86_26500, partial [Imperialibacter sp.]
LIQVPIYRANAFKTNWTNYFQSCFSTPALKGETALKFFFFTLTLKGKKNFKAVSPLRAGVEKQL